MRTRLRLRPARLAAAAGLIVVAWWALGRATSPWRRLTVHHVPASGPLDSSRIHQPELRAGEAVPGSTGDTARSHNPPDTIKVLSWNIAHGRGTVRQGWTNNWRGGSEEERLSRLAQIARVIGRTGAQIVILNEVDFDSQWSNGVNQAEFISRVAGYASRVEQRNYDMSLPLLRWAFGNALLTSLSVGGTDWVDLPPHSRLEAVLLGAKDASVMRLRHPGGCLAVVPVHLEVRGRQTRLEALPAFRNLQGQEACPLILAGDFNSAPSGWPGAPEGTVVDSLLDLGWESPRAVSPPDSLQMTFPTSNLRDARDWVLAEPPLRVIRVRVLHEADHLSDHSPVLAVIVVGGDTISGE